MSRENETVQKNFLTIREGKFRQSVKQKTETSKENVVDDKTYHYEEFTTVKGHLRKMMQWTEEKNDKTWEMFAIDLRDEKGELECVQMYFDSNATVSFLKRLPNIDLSKEIKITIREDDKGYPRLDVYQTNAEGELKLIPFFWTKEKPLPAWRKLKEATKTKPAVWDRSEQEELLQRLYNLKNAEIADTIKAVQRDGVTHQQLEEMKEESEFGKVLNYKPEEKAQTANDDDLSF